MLETTQTPLAALALQEISATAWQLLESGMRSAADPFHTPVIATQSDHGPAQRTVVLRYVEAGERIIACHTDRRSAKAREVTADPRISWLFYDAKRKLQLRLAGHANVHTEGTFFDHCWSQVSEMSQACYNTQLGPGQCVDEPPVAPSRVNNTNEASTARSHFAVIVCKVTFLEWLFLSAKGHRRARLIWHDERLEASWITP